MAGRRSRGLRALMPAGVSKPKLGRGGKGHPSRRSKGISSPEDKIQIYVKSGHLLKLPVDCPTKEDDGKGYRITVKPTLTVSDLKDLLKKRRGLPKGNLSLLLLGGDAPNVLDDDNATLTHYGVRYHDTLYATQEGSYGINVYSVQSASVFPVYITSPLQTVRYLKEEMSEMIGAPVEDQKMCLVSDPLSLPLADDTSLFDLGFVYPYLLEMDRPVHLRLLTPPQPPQILDVSPLRKPRRKTPRPAKIQISVKSAHVLFCPWECSRELSDDRRQMVSLTVDPTLTVGALKSLLRARPWIPNNDLLLIRQSDTTLLDKDASTLSHYGIDDRHSILACKEGSFQVALYSVAHMHDFSVPVTSCYQTVRTLKEGLHLITGHPPEGQIISRSDDPEGAPLPDTATLVSLNIVKPYLAEMVFTPSLKVEMPDLMP